MASIVNSLYNDCVGYQEKCPYIKLSLIRSNTVVEMQCLVPSCIVLTSRMSLHQVSLQREITVLHARHLSIRLRLLTYIASLQAKQTCSLKVCRHQCTAICCIERHTCKRTRHSTSIGIALHPACNVGMQSLHYINRVEHNFLQSMGCIRTQARSSHVTAEHDHGLFELAALSHCFHQTSAQMTGTAVLPAGEEEHCAKATRGEGLCHACVSKAFVNTPCCWSYHWVHFASHVHR